jgi:hypothetical protein
MSTLSRDTISDPASIRMPRNLPRRIKMPSNLPHRVKTAFNKARESGDLTYYPTQVTVLNVNSIPVSLLQLPYPGRCH